MGEAGRTRRSHPVSGKRCGERRDRRADSRKRPGLVSRFLKFDGADFRTATPVRDKPTGDLVWVAARFSERGKGRESDARYRNLCRRLGFGMLAVTKSGQVEVIVSPTSVARRDPKRRSRLVTEHKKRQGDPALGGSTRSPIMTAYRQQALACASALSGGPRKVRELKPAIPDAPKILLHNVYGWFDRVERGIYVLTDAGRAALKRWPQQPIELSVASGVAS